MKLFIWFKRKIFWLYLKIVREKASPEYIARGWAIGMFYGCLVPFGAQLILSIPTSFALKGSKIGASLGTLLTNHFTIFIIYPCQCYVGAKLLGYSQSYSDIAEAFSHVLKEESVEALIQIGGELLASFFVGGALLTAIMTPLTYILVKRMVIKHRERMKAKQRIRQVIAKK